MVNKKTQCHESELLPLDQTPKQSKKMTEKIPLKTKKFKSVGVNTNITFPVNMNSQDDSDSQDEVSPEEDNDTSFRVSDNSDSHTDSSDSTDSIKEEEKSSTISNDSKIIVMRECLKVLLCFF